MSGERSLPEQPSLRYLRLEAKRRRAAGEFPTLHHAQLAIAREHGQPSWAALREAVADAPAASEGHAIAQLRWITARFRDAGAPGWTAPGDDELRARFTDQFLANVPPDRLVATITGVSGELRADFTVVQHGPFNVTGQLSGHLVMATTEQRPPYRISGLAMRRLGARVGDPRVASPATSTSGVPPAGLTALAEAALAQLGLPGLSLAGGTHDAGAHGGRPRGSVTRERDSGGSGGSGGGTWAAATGWADLEAGRRLTPGHAFPAHGITGLVTALCVLRLAADGRLRLDDRAGRYLTAIRLADDTVTVRELLTHTAGVADPPRLYRRAAASLAEVAGPVLDRTGRRGTFQASLTGYAVLGDLVAELAGEPYQDAADRLVLRPLEMRGSWFPPSWPAGQSPGEAPLPVPATVPATVPGPSPGPSQEPVPPTVTGYDVAADGTFTPQPGLVCALPAGGGLWTTAADLVRLGLGWPDLLPRSLAEQMLRPHATQPIGIAVGLGWAVNERAGLAGYAADGPASAASLLVTLDGRHACAALASRPILLEPVSGAALALTAGAARAEPAAVPGA